MEAKRDVQYPETAGKAAQMGDGGMYSGMERKMETTALFGLHRASEPHVQGPCLQQGAQERERERERESGRWMPTTFLILIIPGNFPKFITT